MSGPAEESNVTDEQHEGGYRSYLVTWFWLLIITGLEVAIVLVRVPNVLLALSLLILALMKAALIMGYFMHLRYERLSLVYAVVLPLLLAVVLFFGVAPDAVNVLRSR